MSTPKDKTVTCCSCEVKFKDNAAYLAHTCETTGYAPTDAKHFGSSFLNVQKAAIKRGGKGKISKKVEDAIDADIAEVKAKGIDHKLATHKVAGLAKKEKRVRTD